MIRLLFSAFFAFFMLSACRSPVSDSSPKDNVSMRFLISGSDLSKLNARLLLSSAATLTISLTPVGSAAVVGPQTKTISAGTGQVDFTFSLDVGSSYAVAATASDSSGTVLFQQSSTITVATPGNKTLTLALVPANSSGLANLSLNTPVPGTLAAGKSVSFVIPSSAMTSSCFRVSLSGGTASSVLCYIQNQNGTLLSSTATDRLFAAQATSGGYAFVTLYNSDSADQAYTVQVLAPLSAGGTWSTATPATPTVTFTTAPTTVYYGVPATFTAGYDGSASSAAYAWYLDGTAISRAYKIGNGTAAGTLAIVPNVSSVTAGTHTLMVTVTDSSTGLSYSASTQVTAAANAFTTTKLVAEWLLQGNALDTSGNGYNGTVTGTAASIPTGHAAGYTAYDMGSSGTITFPYSALRFPYTQPFTISVWMKAVGAITSGWANVLGVQGNGGEYQFYFTLQYSNELELWAGQSFGGGVFVDFTPFVADTWYHVAFVFDGTYVYGYLNGVKSGPSAAFPYTPAVSTTDFRFSSGSEAAFDTCRVYTRALTSPEVQALYHE